MKLNNSFYCHSSPDSYSCSLRKSNYCQSIEYEYWAQDNDFFTGLSAWMELVVDGLDVLLSTMIILISIFGKIDGTFKWCILNIAIFHLGYPIFTRIIGTQALSKLPMSSWGNNSILRNLVVNGLVGKSREKKVPLLHRWNSEYE